MQLSKILILLLIGWFSGCTAIGVPYTSDPREKLAMAYELMNRLDRPVPAEMLIHDAIEICQETKDSECLVLAYIAYARFYQSPAMEGRFQGFYEDLDKTEKLAKSAEYYDKAINVDPDNAEFYFIRGRSYFDHGQFDQAMKDYEKAIALNPKKANFHIMRGVVHEKQGQYDQAISDYAKVIALEPNKERGYNLRSEAYKENGQFDRALTDLDTVVSLTPEDASAYNIRGFAYNQMGFYDKGISDFDKAIALNPDSKYAYMNRGIAFYYTNRFQLAMKDFEKGADVNPTFNFYTIWLYLATEGAGKNGMEVLKTRSSEIDLETWPGLLVALYLGKFKPQELLEKVNGAHKSVSKFMLCESYFHMGKLYLQQNNKSDALQMFRKSVETEAFKVNEYLAAKEELKRLEKNVSP